MGWLYHIVTDNFAFIDGALRSGGLDGAAVVADYAGGLYYLDYSFHSCWEN
jgi:hypothetical protein